jgi:anti-sigma regulatory factor (Ser/Thr protein kinase)
LSEDRQADVALATSELVANALDHGGAGEVIVTHQLASEHLEISVSSTMAGTLPTGATQRVAVTSIQGRGLGIVAHVCDGVIIEGVSGRVVVRCRFEVAPGRVSIIDPPARL